jgi:DNA-binding GntR family transcriptional regulator
MARSNILFKRCYNRLLDTLAGAAVGEMLPSVAEWSRVLGVSASTANQVAGALERAGIARREQRRRVLARQPAAENYFPDAETHSPAKRIEEEFLRRIVGGNARPGDDVNALQLARAFGTSTALVREFLIRFSRFGLIEKRPNRHWVLLGLTPEFIEEVLSVKEAFLMLSATAMLQLPADNPLWGELRTLRDGLTAFVEKQQVGAKEFQDLEFGCQRLLARAARNRFITDFTETAATIVYYNFQIDRDWEIRENKAGAEMWTKFIDSIVARNLLDIRYWNRKLIEQGRAAYQVAMSGRVPPAPSPLSTTGMSDARKPELT